MRLILKLLASILQISNCAQAMKTILSTQEHRYRSVKYKLNRDISVAANQSTMDRKAFLPSTAKNSMNRSRRNHTKFSFSNISECRNSMPNWEVTQEDKMKRTSYMDTFNFMLSMERNRYNAKEKDREQGDTNDKLNPQTTTMKLDRVQLPVLNQLQSQFTVLDNVHLPISYLNEEIIKIGKQMAIEETNAKKIRHELKQIEKKTLSSLTEVQQTAIIGFEKLRNFIKSNKVMHQQQNLKQKSALQKCKTYLPEYYKDLESSKQRICELQDEIFKGTPFQLQQRPEFQVAQSKYF